MNRFKIKTKLRLLLLSPLIGLFIVAGLISYERYQRYVNFDMLNKVVLLSTKVTSLVHELQKERGMTAGFLASNGKNFTNKLPRQRELTDQKIHDFENNLKEITLVYYKKDFSDLLYTAQNKLENIKKIRKDIMNFKISGKNAISYYTKMNTSFLELVRKTASFSIKNEMTIQLTSYTNFLLAKERAGIERAVGAVSFANDHFAIGAKLKFNRLISEQNAYLNSFEKLANKKAYLFYKKVLSGPIIKDVNNMRNIALNAKDEKNFNIDSFHWFKTITKKINMLKQIDDEIARELIQSAKELSHEAKLWMIIFIVLSCLIVLLSLFLGKIISSNIEDGVTTLAQGLDGFFKFLNKESKDCNLITIDENRVDVIGQMSKKVNSNILISKEIILDDIKFMEEVKNIVSKIKTGYLNQRLEYKTKSPNLQDLKAEINQMLEVLNNTIGGNINEITEVLNSYSNLDFTNNIHDAHAKVEKSILHVGQIVTTMLQDNKRDGLTINKSTNELLKNVDILNHSSNEAAASLEETSAALEEITASITQNTHNIITMSEIAKEVTSSVNKGQVLANQTTTAMDEINEQVLAINDSISLIDQIAFQTNILSLNAAVEAATAGEAGKGFAVVAQEVRNLASRSAQAAKDIKDLVEQATLKANDGKTIADQMIDGYTNLNEGISKTIELIQDVTFASKEQQEGIHQINDAVSTLDQQTQKNAQVAAHTSTIANETSQIAKKIVQNADEKIFEGKDSIVL